MNFLLILAASVILAWDPSPEPVDGYRLHIGLDHIQNAAPVQILDVGKVTQYEVEGLDYGTTYYFYATAYLQAEGIILCESGYSNEVAYTPMPPAPPTPSPDGTKALTVADSTGRVWTFNAQRQTLRDGIWMGKGLGRMYKYVGGVVYVFGVNGTWWQWTEIRWLNVGPEPETPAPAPAPPQDLRAVE